MFIYLHTHIYLWVYRMEPNQIYLDFDPVPGSCSSNLPYFKSLPYLDLLDNTL